MKKLQLENLLELPGITYNVGCYFLEASIHALKICGHKNGVALTLTGNSDTKFKLRWRQILNKDVAKTWNDEQELVEYAATGIALLLAQQLTEYTEYQRSAKGTGADYWLGNIDESGFPIMSSLMEISGIKIETPSNYVNKRIREKQRRLELNILENITYFICVTEFNTPKAKFIQHEK